MWLGVRGAVVLTPRHGLGRPGWGQGPPSGLPAQVSRAGFCRESSHAACSLLPQRPACRGPERAAMLPARCSCSGLRAAGPESCLGETRLTLSAEETAPHTDQVTQELRAPSMPAVPEQTRLQGPGAASQEGRPNRGGRKAHAPRPKPSDAGEALPPRERILAMDWAKDGFSATMSTVFILPRAASAPPHSALEKRLRHRVGAASPELLR